MMLRDLLLERAESEESYARSAVEAANNYRRAANEHEVDIGDPPSAVSTSVYLRYNGEISFRVYLPESGCNQYLSLLMERFGINRIRWTVSDRRKFYTHQSNGVSLEINREIEQPCFKALVVEEVEFCGDDPPQNAIKVFDPSYGIDNYRVVAFSR